jgi:hypothetical protein
VKATRGANPDGQAKLLRPVLVAYLGVEDDAMGSCQQLHAAAVRGKARLSREQPEQRPGLPAPEVQVCLSDHEQGCNDAEQEQDGHVRHEGPRLHVDGHGGERTHYAAAVTRSQERPLVRADRDEAPRATHTAGHVPVPACPVRSPAAARRSTAAVTRRHFGVVC